MYARHGQRLLRTLTAAVTLAAVLCHQAVGQSNATSATPGFASGQLDPRVDYSALLKPRYHITPPWGWMNDPNGMFQQKGSPVHIFYQWNPAQPIWGAPWWGHVVSHDYVKWKRLPPALKPDQWYDADGVFSGSATVLPNGSPYLMYTGVMNFSKLGFYYQQQAAAVPANLSDPLLVKWTKLATNPLSMSTPPGGTHAQFRDPTTAWQVSPHSDHLDKLLAALKGQSGLLGNNSMGNSTSGSTSNSSMLISTNSTDNSTTSPTLISTNSTNSTPAGNSISNSTMGNSTAGDQRALENMAVSPPPGFHHSAAAHQAAASVQAGGVWMSAVGVLDDCEGAAALYLSNDSLRTWQYAGTLFSQLSQEFNQNKQCLPPANLRNGPAWDAPSGARAYGRFCDQFGKHCRMWECPDYFPVTSAVQAFKYSDQETGRNPFGADYFVLGDTSLINYANAPVQDAHDVYSARLGGKPYTPRQVDYGAVYASKSFQPAGSSRRLWLGWVFEQALYCTETCSNGTDFIFNYLGWQGSQTLIREITYIPETKTLRFQPIPEVQKLRQMPALVNHQFTLDTQAAAGRLQGQNQSESGTVHAVIMPGREPDAVMQYLQKRNDSANSTTKPWFGASSNLLGTTDSKVSSPSGGRQVELMLSFTLRVDSNQQQQSTTGPFTLTVRIHTGGGTYTDVFLNGTCNGTSSRTAGLRSGQTTQTPILQEFNAFVDRSHSGGQSTSDPTKQGGQVPLPSGMQAADIQLQVFVDRSIIEVYVMKGAAVITSRIYPTPVLPPDVSGPLSPLPGTAERVVPVEDPPALGAWGYELLGQWEGGWVDVQAQVYEMSDCWEGP